MQTQQYTKEAQEALNTFLAPHPLITHAYHKQQIARSVEHYLLKENAQEITKEILVKANAIDLLRNELSRKRVKWTIGTGSMNDPYMPLEKKINLTGRAG